jgi:two-component system cell cycle response regulator
MNASILVVGDDDFRSALLAIIDDLATFTVEIAADPDDAAPLIQAQQPDLLVMQACQPGCLELCHQLKQQSRLAWIYCILLEDIGREPLLGNSFSVVDRSGRQQIEVRIEALEAGADAYVCWLHAADEASDGLTPEVISLQNRFLQAQIRAGLRRVQNHRELMRTNDLLSTIALSDPLTELNNRRALEWELPRQINNARARDTAISLLMLDVDYFKSINDTYGHLVGDRALKLISARLRHNLRYYDTPFRYGGEEFVVILGDTSSQEASLIAQRICRLIGDQPFNVDENLELGITISAGTATLTAEDDPRGNSLLRRADQNLLIAKAQGRNRVVGSEESLSH